MSNSRAKGLLFTAFITSDVISTLSCHMFQWLFHFVTGIYLTVLQFIFLPFIFFVCVRFPCPCLTTAFYAVFFNHVIENELLDAGGWNGVVGAASCYGMYGAGFEHSWRKLISNHTYPDRPWGPPALLYNGSRASLQWVRRRYAWKN